MKFNLEKCKCMIAVDRLFVTTHAVEILQRVLIIMPRES